MKSSLLQVDIADLYAMQLDAVRSDVVEHVLWSLVLMSLWLGLACWAFPSRAERWWNLLSPTAGGWHMVCDLACAQVRRKS